MRAYENVALYCVLPDSERKKHFKAHKKRMKNIKGTLGPKDLNFEPVISPRNNQDSSKITSLRYGKEAVVARNNLVLAKRIFEIMEGPGIISDLMDSDINTHHPGTINFPHRLAEAKRIHNENLIIASRLDAVQPTYYDKSAVSAVRKSSPSKRKRPPHSQRKKAAAGMSDPGMQHSLVQGTQSEEKPAKSKNVLLEYSKVQRGRVLDVAVIKEPFRDSYSIFGIDIDNGQRYELKLSSEEVSNILEGDILVTNVDNVEVWMALISKVELHPVEAFSKTPLPNAAHMTKSETKKPSKPTSLNSSKNQQNNPRLNKMRKKEVKSAATDESAGSSSAINGTDDIDDMSLTTGGEENQANDNDHVALAGLGDDDEDSTRGYTLDEYYEHNAALSPLPSQTGFVTSAPSGRQNPDRNGISTASPKSTSGENRGSDNDSDVAGVAAMSVSFILDTAVKNILINCKKNGKKQGQKQVDKAPPSKKERESNPYTSTKVTSRSNSITYTSTQPAKGSKKEKDHDADHKQDFTTPGKKVSPAKEPQQPTDAPPPEGSRRPVPKHRAGGSSGGPRKKASVAKNDHDSGRKQSRAVDNSTSTTRKQSSAVDNTGLNNSRKKSSAVVADPISRKVSTFRKVDPVTGIMSLCPKVADLAVKSALKRCGDILDLFNLELPES